MKYTATIEKALPEQSGTSKSGKAWRRRSYVAVYDNSNAQYPKSVVFDVLGDKIDQLNIQQGGQYELEIDFEAREWNGRYFLQANCWKATRLDLVQTAPQPAPTPAYPSNDPYAAMMPPKQQVQQTPQQDSDLPF